MRSGQGIRCPIRCRRRLSKHEGSRRAHGLPALIVTLLCWTVLHTDVPPTARLQHPQCHSQRASQRFKLLSMYVYTHKQRDRCKKRCASCTVITNTPHSLHSPRNTMVVSLMGYDHCGERTNVVLTATSNAAYIRSSGVPATLIWTGERLLHHLWHILGCAGIIHARLRFVLGGLPPLCL